MNNGPRYQARHVPGGFGLALVLDTTQIDYRNYHKRVCECDDIETAKAIALALNRTAE